MLDLEQKLGPMRLRAWGLVVNFGANVTLLYGLSQVVANQGGWAWLITGAVATVFCVAILAKPVAPGGGRSVDSEAGQ